MSVATEAPLGAVAAACNWYVIHKNAPGAMSAMAFILAPSNPKVGLMLGMLRSVMILSSFNFYIIRQMVELIKCKSNANFGMLEMGGGMKS
jgi:hypothetical protein